MDLKEFNHITVDSVIYVVYNDVVVISENRCLVGLDNRMRLLTTSGEILAEYDTILPPKYYYMDDDGTGCSDSEYLAFHYVDGYLLATEDGVVGLLNYNGDVVVPLENREIAFESNDTVGIIPMGISGRRMKTLPDPNYATLASMKEEQLNEV